MCPTPARSSITRAAVAGAVGADGTVQLPKTYRYAVATPTSWAVLHRLDNESGSVSDRPGGRD